MPNLATLSKTNMQSLNLLDTTESNARHYLNFIIKIITNKTMMVFIDGYVQKDTGPAGTWFGH